jgi:hypothetical protein
MNRTSVFDLDDTKYIDSVPKLVSDTDPESIRRKEMDNVLDMSISLEDRLSSLVSITDIDIQIEFLNKIIGMYSSAGVRSLKEYLIGISFETKLPVLLRSLAAVSLCGNNEEKGFKALSEIIPEIGSLLATTHKFELITTLMKNRRYRSTSLPFLYDIIDDKKLDCSYRYKMILKLEYNLPEKDSLFFIKKGCYRFLFNSENNHVHRILSAQYLLRKQTSQEQKERDEVESVLLSFSNDKDLEYNLRADSADVVLQFGSDKNKETAREIINSLGKTPGGRTMFDNKQNVHSISIEKSAESAVEFLSTIPILEIDKKPIDFDYVESKLIELVLIYKNNISPTESSDLQTRRENSFESVRGALDRIYMDRGLYSNYSYSLITILLKIWSYIQVHDKREELETRLIEELIDMSGTCSSGYVTRLVNTISGFGNFNMKISWKEQIVGNLTGRMNARIRALPESDFKDNVLNEMTLPTEQYSERKNFLDFFRKNFLSIREEMVDEFKEHLEPEMFDFYFREAISIYETGS